MISPTSWRHALRSLPLLAALSLGCLSRSHAAEPPALVMEMGGLKHLYRVVFTEFDDANHFASGALEIYDLEDEETVHTRVPFSAEIKPDPKNRRIELLEIRCTSLLAFFPPKDAKEPYPTLTWTLTGRKTGMAVLNARFWAFDGDKETWALTEIELEKAAGN